MVVTGTFTHQVGPAKHKLHSSLGSRAGDWWTGLIQYHQHKHIQGLTVKGDVVLLGNRANKVSDTVLFREKMKMSIDAVRDEYSVVH